MIDDLVRNLREQINAIPPIIRLAVLLSIVDVIYEELPNAEREYNLEKQRLSSRFANLVREVLNSD